MTMTSIETETSLAGVYRHAHESAVLVDRGALGLLQLTGASCLDLINRMSTQAVKNLKDGEGAATVLTTDIGRIIDRVILYAFDDRALLLTGEGHADDLARYLMRNIFFNDDVQVKDLSAETIVWGVYGLGAGGMLSTAGFPEVDIPLHHWRRAKIGSATAYVHRTDPVAGDGYYVTANTSDREAIVGKLLAAGLMPIDEAAYDYLRIEAGQPRFGRELTLDYIPLEAGLWDDVSFHKGCYIGQEIIARMESRGKLAKRLVRLRPAAPLAPGAEISSARRVVGTITSAADGPAGPVALGYVKTSALDEGAELAAGDVKLVVL
jgi:aminomethyltransferase